MSNYSLLLSQVSFMYSVQSRVNLLETGLFLSVPVTALVNLLDNYCQIFVYVSYNLFTNQCATDFLRVNLLES